MKSPAAAHRGTVIDAQVRTTDILPTILSATGVAAPAELNGESLFPLIDDKTSDDKTSEPATTRRALFGETDYPLRWGWAPLRALRTENAKLIEAPRPEMYDLPADPKELKNLYASDNSKVTSLQSEMAKWKAKLPPQSNSAKPGEVLPDPKDKIEVQNLLHNAMLADDDNRSADARQFLEKALQLDPSSPTALRQLGELELAAGDFAKAAVHLKRACELRPEDSTAAFELGQAAEKSGDWAGARDALESGLKLVPSQMSARLQLGRVYLQLKDAKNAQDQFEAALLVDSNDSAGRLGLAEAQILQSDFAGALPDLEAFTKSNPEKRCRPASAGASLSRTRQGAGCEANGKSSSGLGEEVTCSCGDGRPRPSNPSESRRAGGAIPTLVVADFSHYPTPSIYIPFTFSLYANFSVAGSTITRVSHAPKKNVRRSPTKRRSASTQRAAEARPAQPMPAIVMAIWPRMN